jgi:inhibitor of cysteine peptidase
MNLTTTDRGQTVHARTGDSVTLRLPENPTTGYRWMVEAAGALALVDDHTDSAGSACGTPGMRVLAFRISSAGTHELRLSHRRAWDPPGESLDQFTARIVAS